MYIHIHKHIHIYAYKHINTHIHTHTHTGCVLDSGDGVSHTGTTPTHTLYTTNYYHLSTTNY
jgi:hypothetical protein